MGVLAFYLLAYFLRLYIMNYFKNTGAKKIDNKAYFGIEQIAASITMLIAAIALYFQGGEALSFAGKFTAAVQAPHLRWPEASFSGLAYGMVAFFSVFLFLLPGRSATFAGLANRLTSLLAGTAATIVACLLFAAPWPSRADWISLLLILTAVGFLTAAEMRHSKGGSFKLLGRLRTILSRPRDA